MKAIVLNAYGGPDVLELKEVDRPVVTENDVPIEPTGWARRARHSDISRRSTREAKSSSSCEVGLLGDFAGNRCSALVILRGPLMAETGSENAPYQNARGIDYAERQ